MPVRPTPGSSPVTGFPPGSSGLNSRHERTSYVIDMEDFRNPVPGMWNDGVGSSTRDTAITIGGLPALRLDTQGVSGSPASPAAPTFNTPVPVAGGGTFANIPYFWRVSGITLTGEGAGSTERTATPAAGGSAPLVWTQVDGYIGYNIYRSTTTNTEVLIATVGQVGTYLDTGSAAISAQGYLATSTAQNPGRTAVTSGVVTKRRIHDSFLDTFGVECWFRLTSSNNTSNAFPSLSIYNRDGTSAWHGRLWLKPQGNNLPIDACILDGATTAQANTTPLTGTGAIYRRVDTSLIQNSSGTHLYEPSSGRMDRAGGWHWCKLVVDFATKSYVSCQIDGNAAIDLSGYTLDQTTTSGFAGMHLSFEYHGSTSTARYMHIARVVITKETSL